MAGARSHPPLALLPELFMIKFRRNKNFSNMATQLFIVGSGKRDLGADESGGREFSRRYSSLVRSGKCFPDNIHNYVTPFPCSPPLSRGNGGSFLWGTLYVFVRNSKIFRAIIRLIRARVTNEPGNPNSCHKSLKKVRRDQHTTF